MIMGLIIDAKDMDVSQPIWLSGCPIKGQFKVRNRILTIGWFEKACFINSFLTCNLTSHSGQQ